MRFVDRLFRLESLWLKRGRKMKRIINLSTNNKAKIAARRCRPKPKSDGIENVLMFKPLIYAVIIAAAITQDVGFFSAIDLKLYYLFSLQEHIMFSTAEIPIAIATTATVWFAIISIRIGIASVQSGETKIFSSPVSTQEKFSIAVFILLFLVIFFIFSIIGKLIMVLFVVYGLTYLNMYKNTAINDEVRIRNNTAFAIVIALTFSFRGLSP